MATLVTGASGFLGRHLVKALAQQGERVLAVHRRPQPPFEHSNVTWHRAEMSGAGDWASLLDGITTAYHLAWSTLPQSSNESPSTDAIVNIGGTLRLLENLNKRSKCRVIFASSGGTLYGGVAADRATERTPIGPLCAYGVSKLAVENYMAMFETLWGLDHVSLRFSNAYGPDQETGRNFGVIATFVARAMQGLPCTIYGDGQAERDFLYVDDAISALLAAGAGPLPERAYNIGSGEGHTILQVTASISAALGQTVETIFAPARDFDAPRTVLDPSLAARDMGWSIKTSFEQGLAKVVAAHREANAA